MSRPLEFQVLHAEPGTWTADSLPDVFEIQPALLPFLETIEKRAKETSIAGAFPVWEGYRDLEDYPTDVSETALRRSSHVRTQRHIGEFYAWMVTSARPEDIVEIGGAFGVSGMYWCAGLSANGAGRFTTFEPNAIWAEFAAANIRSILDSARLVVGTFEDHVDRAPAGIDLAFIDAIHTPECVEAQLSLVLDRARPGAMIVMDDIRFSPKMTAYWDAISRDSRFAAAFEVTHRVGILELPR